MDIDGVHRHATPLLHVKNMPCPYALKEAVLTQQRGIEKRLEKDPEQAGSQRELVKLVQAAYVVKLSQEQVDNTKEPWSDPQHIVHILGKTGKSLTVPS